MKKIQIIQKSMFVLLSCLAMSVQASEKGAFGGNRRFTQGYVDPFGNVAPWHQQRMNELARLALEQNRVDRQGRIKYDEESDRAQQEYDENEVRDLLKSSETQEKEKIQEVQWNKDQAKKRAEEARQELEAKRISQQNDLNLADAARMEEIRARRGTTNMQSKQVASKQVAHSSPSNNLWDQLGVINKAEDARKEIDKEYIEGRRKINENERDDRNLLMDAYSKSLLEAQAKEQAVSAQTQKVAPRFGTSLNQQDSETVSNEEERARQEIFSADDIGFLSNFTSRRENMHKREQEELKIKYDVSQRIAAFERALNTYLRDFKISDADREKFEKVKGYLGDTTEALDLEMKKRIDGLKQFRDRFIEQGKKHITGQLYSFEVTQLEEALNNLENFKREVRIKREQIQREQVQRELDRRAALAPTKK